MDLSKGNLLSSHSGRRPPPPPTKTTATSGDDGLVAENYICLFDLTTMMMEIIYLWLPSRYWKNIEVAENLYDLLLS